MPEIINSINKDFESIKKIDENGVGYWEARELLPLLGYEKWQNAVTAFSKMAKIGLNSAACIKNQA